jgi:hypothetical protein
MDLRWRVASSGVLPAADLGTTLQLKALGRALPIVI